MIRELSASWPGPSHKNPAKEHSGKSNEVSSSQESQVNHIQDDTILLF